MNKVVIVINGKGGVGKDTLCSFVSKHYKIMNISSVDPIKEIAKTIGWDGKKDNKSRKLLSDLKRISTEYNNFPNKYLLEKYSQFMRSDFEILFVHIRESEQIQNFIQELDIKTITLLIRRTTINSIYGNNSDDNVEKYDYDYIYNNDKSIIHAETDFLNFFDKLLTTEGIKHESNI